MLKLKLQFFGHLMWTADSLKKTLMLSKTEDKRRGTLRMRRLDSITDSMDMNLSKLQEIVEDRRAWRAVVHGVTDSWTWVNDWTTTRVLNWGKFNRVCVSRFLLESSHLWRDGCFFLLGIGRASLTQGSYNLLQSKVRVFPVPTTSYIPLA